MNVLRARARALMCGAAALSIALSALAAPAQEPARAPGVANDEYAARRRALMEKTRDGIVVLRGSTESEFGEVGRFRQNNQFYYLTGVETPHAFLMLNPAAPAGQRETLYIPARNPAAERWTGVQMGPGPEAAAAFGIEQVKDATTLDVDIRAALAADSATTRMRRGERFRIYTVFPSGDEAQFSRDRAFALGLLDRAGGRYRESIELENVEFLLGEMRRIKSAGEVKLLQRAIDITAEAHRDLARLAAPGRYEYELEATIVAAYLRNGAMRAGFPSIVGSGVYSTILHYNANSRRIEDGDLIVVDIGAEYGYYTADITRTYPANGRFTPRQREIYQLVLDAQEAAARHYKPGMSMRDLHNAAVAFMRASPLRDRQGNTLDRYFIHGLSHYLGMDVHDVGLFGAPLMPGDVFTIEPGIYIQDEKIGVRIEDDYLVTETGLVKLSAALASSPDDVERMMARERK